MKKLKSLIVPYRRGGSCAGSAMPKPDYGPMEVQRSKLSNGIKLAAIKPSGTQIAAATIMYQAGSRFEHNHTLGVTHFLRADSTGSSKHCTRYMKSRYLSQLGASLTCTSDRQTIAYTLRCPSTLFPDLKCILVETAARSHHYSWEIDDVKQLVREDLHRMHPGARAIDLLQTAFWSGGLGRSIYCQPYRIDDMDSAKVCDFVRDHIKPSNCTVATVGIPFKETMKMAEMIEGSKATAVRKGFEGDYLRRSYESYELGPGSDTWIALGLPGASSNDMCSLFKLSILAAAIGTGNTQMGQHSMDRISQAPLGKMSGQDIYTTYRAFNISYMGQGIFGILAKTRAATAWKVGLSASEFLANVGDINTNQIDIGKKRLQVSLAIHDEDAVKVAEGMALQLANDIEIDSAIDAYAMIAAIPNPHIICAAKDISKNSNDMAVAVVGDVKCAPNDCEICRTSKVL